jgi:ubiquitin-protein ligase E3 A
MVTFRGEEALDAGGVGREFFHLLMAQLFSPNYGMFTVVNGNYYWFRTMGAEEMETYAMLGTVVALAAYNHILLPIRFPLLLYKKLLRKTIRLNDLAELEPDVARGLKELIMMKERGEDLASVMMTFTVMVDNFGTNEERELVENGANLDVSNDNVEQYVHEALEWYVNRSVHPQFEAFQKGFHRLFGWDRIKMFAPDELDLLLSGEVVLEWADLRKNARYVDGYRADSKSIELFWVVFEDKAKLLRFLYNRYRSRRDRRTFKCRDNNSEIDGYIEATRLTYVLLDVGIA